MNMWDAIIIVIFDVIVDYKIVLLPTNSLFEMKTSTLLLSYAVTTITAAATSCFFGYIIAAFHLLYHKHLLSLTFYGALFLTTSQ